MAENKVRTVYNPETGRYTLSFGEDDAADLTYKGGQLDDLDDFDDDDFDDSDFDDGDDFDDDDFDDDDFEDGDFDDDDFDDDDLDGDDRRRLVSRKKPVSRTAAKKTGRPAAKRPAAHRAPKHREMPPLNAQQILLVCAKLLCLALIVVFLLRQTDTDKLSSTPYETVEAAVSNAAALETMQPGDNLMVKRLYGIDPNTYEGVFFYYPTSNMGAEEVLLVKYSGDAQKEEIREAMEKRLASQLDVFEGYGIDQTAMLGKAIIEVRGGYALFVSADDPVSVRDAFLAAL